MTSMDKKINELNAKLGRKTGVDFKGSAIQISKDLYQNKPAFAGTVAGLGAFVFTSAGFILAPLFGVGVAYGYSKAENILNELKAA